MDVSHSTLLSSTFMVVELNQRKIKWLGESHTGNSWQSQEFPESQPTIFSYCFSSSSLAVFKIEVNPTLSIHLCICTHLRDLPTFLQRASLRREGDKGQEKGLISCTPCTCQKLKHRPTNAVCSRPHRKFVAERGNLIYIPWNPVQEPSISSFTSSYFIWYAVCTT